MSAAFAFLPRKVANSTKTQRGHAASGPLEVSGSAPVPRVDKGKRKEIEQPEPPESQLPKPQHSEEDYTTLLCLSLSHYALWSNPDLRRKIEWSSTGSNDGFFPLSYILDIACPLSATHASEAVIVKALRTFGKELVDVRMALVSGDGFGKRRGNFDIRPKFWDEVTCSFSKDGWDSRTIYVENIPVKYKNFAGFSRFILALLPTPGATSHSRIQGITLLPHHSDPPGTEPKYKLFALVTFAHAEDVQSLLEAWPWGRSQASQHSGEASEAAKFGFRTLSKAQWDERNAEYLAYRANILAGLEDAEMLPTASGFNPSSSYTDTILPPVPTDNTMHLTSASAYPPNCLVFVRNIHPETNKTTLRNFFAKSMETKDAIDYVDFNKGMDSCYLRLTTPSHAQALVNHFAENRTIHASGLDDAGHSFGNGSAAAVDADLVLGKKEALYWEKVPEKICRQAVQKALGASETSSSFEQTTDSKEGGRRQRKKQKR